MSISTRNHLRPVNIHLKSGFFLTQTLLPIINDGGRIVNISSGLTRFAIPGYIAYSAMKGGIEVITRFQLLACFSACQAAT